jgi:hypothetical protein
MKRLFLLWCALGSWLIAGCGDSYELETAPVNGAVTLDGKSLYKGTVIFTTSRGRTSSGEIQSDGTFQLSTYGKNDGAIVGENQIGVFFATGSELDQGEKSSIPARYANPSGSGLVHDVKSGQDNEIRLELTSVP